MANLNQDRQLVAFITGASSGIGEQLAYALGEKGYHVAAMARRGERLEDVKHEFLKRHPKAAFLSIVGDVTDQACLENAITDILQAFGRIDCVVPNAGFGVYDTFDNLSTEDFQRQLNVNTIAVFNTVKVALKAIKKTKGQIIFIGSVLSHISFPGTSAYAVSKYAVKAMAEALYVEMRPFGVHVSLVSPGFIETEILKVNNQGIYDEKVEVLFPSWAQMSPAKAAKKIVNSALNRKRHIIITTHAKFALFMQRYFPGLVRLTALLSNKYQKRLFSYFGR